MIWGHMANSCFLDANICISYIQLPHQFHEKAVTLISKLIQTQIIPTVSPLVLDEFLYIIKRDYQYKNILKVKAHLAELLSIPNLLILNPSSEVKQQLKVVDLMNKFSLKPRDAYHLMTVQTQKIKYFATFDNDFSQVFKEKVLKRFE